MRTVFGAKETAIDAGRAADVGRLLESVCDAPGKAKAVFAAPGALRSDVTVLVNGRNLVFLNGLQTQIRGGDVVAVSPPIKGG